MSRYAWANPTNSQREQDDELVSAVHRIQAELKQPQCSDLHAVMLYQQIPICRVERNHAYSVAPTKRERLWHRLKLKFSRPPEEEGEVQINGD